MRIVDDEHVHSLAFGYVFNLDEFSPLAPRSPSEVVRRYRRHPGSGGSGTTVTINDVVQGGTYNVGKTGITIESVKVGRPQGPDLPTTRGRDGSRSRKAGTLRTWPTSS